MAKTKRLMPDTVHSAANCLRDVKNWLAVFKTEYDIPREAIRVLNKEFDDIGSSMANITCTLRGVDKTTVRPVANAVRDTKNWLAVFAREYDIASEAKRVLSKKLDELGEKIGKIECK